MKNVILCFIFSLALASSAFAGSRVRSASIEAVCKKTPRSMADFVYKNSAPLRSGGVGTPLIGYRKEPTLICEKRGMCGGSTVIYDSAGTSIGRCPWTDAHGFAGGRYRCTMSTSTLRRKAVKNTRKANIFFKLKDGTCAEVPDAGKCYGSSKGLCNQTIK